MLELYKALFALCESIEMFRAANPEAYEKLKNRFDFELSWSRARKALDKHK